MNRHGPRPLRSFTLPRALLGLLLLLLVGILGVGRRATAEEGLPEKPPEEDRRIARAVGYLLGHLHISRHPLDDEISRRCLQGFLKILDPRKIYFLQRDADELSRSSEELDDMVRKGDLSFPYRAFRRFLERVDERGRWAEELVHAEHDYTVDESLELDPEGTSYPKSEAEARERWRKLVKYELLLEITGDATLEEAREKLSKRYERFVRRMHQTDRHELLEMFLTSLASGYDPHTTYMSAYSLDNFEIHLRLELDGIGAMLTMEDGHTTVRSIIPGGAADRDGRLKPKDRIVAVGQGPAGETVDVVGMKLSDVVQMIRGKRGDIVRLKVLPVGGTEAVVYDITRARIELKDRVAEGEVFEHGRRPDGSPYKIGVIDLPSFYRDMTGAREGKADFRSTSRDVRAILEGFREQGADVVVVDLRRNGGGFLKEAVDLTGLFIERGPVVVVKDSSGELAPRNDDDPGVAWEGPLVVLTSKHSASASEIFAGAIQDYRRGVVVGDPTTHGKGTVQTLIDLGARFAHGTTPPRWGALKITFQQYYRPNGASTQSRGVIADVTLPSISAHRGIGEAEQDYALSFDEVVPLPFAGADRIDPEVLEKLRKRSEQRVKASKEFKEQLEAIARYLEREKRTAVTLNKEKFLAERARDEKSAREESPEEEGPVDLFGSEIRRNFYLDEAFSIAIDLLCLERGGTPPN